MEEEKKYIYNDKAERIKKMNRFYIGATICLLYTSPSPRDTR